jgi:hypothetical protein
LEIGPHPLPLSEKEKGEKREKFWKSNWVNQ